MESLESTPSGNPLWKPLVETPCGNAYWNPLVVTPSGITTNRGYLQPPRPRRLPPAGEVTETETWVRQASLEACTAAIGGLWAMCAGVTLRSLLVDIAVPQHLLHLLHLLHRPRALKVRLHRLIRG